MNLGEKLGLVISTSGVATHVITDSQAGRGGFIQGSTIESIGGDKIDFV
jgi:hypothetical protein